MSKCLSSNVVPPGCLWMNKPSLLTSGFQLSSSTRVQRNQDSFHEATHLSSSRSPQHQETDSVLSFFKRIQFQCFNHTRRITLRSVLLQLDSGRFLTASILHTLVRFDTRNYISCRIIHNYYVSVYKFQKMTEST
jgi:hypothetical protein